MDRTERFYLIDQLLHERRVVPIDAFLHSLGVSRATFKRDLEYLRERLHAPIVWDAEQRGYRFGEQDSRMRQYALPGLWFNASEIHALLTMQQLLGELQPGLLEPHVAPLRARVEALLDSGEHAAEEVRARIRLLNLGARRVDPQYFEVVSHALLARRRLTLRHYNRQRGEESEREVSPQRLVYYRDNWYLDAWCHLRGGLRSFGLSGVRRALMLDRRARNVPKRVLDTELGSGYGIFAGTRTARARLRFTPERARWVADECWHPQQQGRFDAEGRYLLELPYSDSRELVMDILRHGAEVEVLAPAALRREVAAAHAAAAARYLRGPGGQVLADESEESVPG